MTKQKANAPVAVEAQMASMVQTSHTLKVKRLNDAAVLPKYQTAGAACFDLHAASEGHVSAGGSMTFDTGLAFEVPAGFVMLVYSRSGHGFAHDVRLGNCVGVIDSDYRGQVYVRLANDNHRAPFAVALGDRIAQAMLVQVEQWSIEEVVEVSETERGDGGFGSTGA